jgi:transcription elongation GreA/GreB family factor
VSTLKQQLYEICVAYAAQKINDAQAAIQLATESAEADTKSSAGDKYETAREMLKQEIEKAQMQLAEAEKLKQQLFHISAESKSETVAAGSLVITDNGLFYVAVAAGQHTLNGKTYIIISPASPLAQKMLGQKAGSAFTLNNRTYVIKKVA